jgi:hypothetical protein
MAFCPECGYDMGDSNECPICKTVIDIEVAEQDFCSNDESVVLTEIDNEQIVPVLLENEFRPKRSKILVAFSSVVVLLIALVIIFANFVNNPKSITNKTLEAIKEENIYVLMQTVPYDKIYADSDIDYVSTVRNSYIQKYGVAYFKVKAFTGIDLHQITWEIKKVKDCDEDELESIQDYWDDNFDITVKDLKTVKVKLKDGKYDEIVNFAVIKIGGKWYMADDQLTFLDN